jgi:hypothetical protein
MNMLTKLKSFVVLLFVCTFLLATSLTSCGNKGEAAGEEHPAGEEEHPKEEKAEHPAGKEEHPKSKSDTTKVEEQ